MPSCKHFKHFHGGNKGSLLYFKITMSHTGALPVVEAVEKIFDLYNEHNPNPGQIRITTNGPPLWPVNVFKALLNHAISPSSVAKSCWEFLAPFFNDVLQEHGDPTDPQSIFLSPRNGDWTTVENMLLELQRERPRDGLTQKIDEHAREWMITLLLPSTFLSLIAFDRVK